MYGRVVCFGCSAKRCLGGAALRRTGPSVVLSPLFGKPRFYIPAALVLCALIGVGIYSSRRQPVRAELAFSEFLQEIDRGHVKQVRFAEGAVTMTLADGSVARTVPPPSFLTSDAGFISNLAHRGMRTENQQLTEPGAASAGASRIAGLFV